MKKTVRKYTDSKHECCCGDPECKDFEDRMAAQGIPLDEITVITMTIPIGTIEEDEQ